MDFNIKCIRIVCFFSPQSLAAVKEIYFHGSMVYDDPGYLVKTPRQPLWRASFCSITAKCHRGSFVPPSSPCQEPRDAVPEKKANFCTNYQGVARE